MLLDELSALWTSPVRLLSDRSRARFQLDAMSEALDLAELIGPHLAPDQLLYRLFHEETPRVYDPQEVAFGCTCSAERVQAAMEQYSAKDIGHMTTEEGKVEAGCQFCGALYVFDPEELGQAR